MPNGLWWFLGSWALPHPSPVSTQVSQKFRRRARGVQESRSLGIQEFCLLVSFLQKLLDQSKLPEASGSQAHGRVGRPRAMEAIRPESGPLRGLPANVRQAIRAFCRPPPHPAAIAIRDCCQDEEEAFRRSGYCWPGLQDRLDNNRGFMSIQSYCWLHRDQIRLSYAAPWTMKLVCQRTRRLPERARFPHGTEGRELWPPALSWSPQDLGDLWDDIEDYLQPLEMVDGPLYLWRAMVRAHLGD